MTDPIYRKAPSNDIERPLVDVGPVLSWANEGGTVEAIVFLCPCGGREVYVTAPPHQIEFDDDARLVLNGSVGSRPVGDDDFRMVHGEALRNLPENWCHFGLSNGTPFMYADAACPGSRPSG